MVTHNLPFQIGKVEWGGCLEEGLVANTLALQPDVATASEVSSSSKSPGKPSQRTLADNHVPEATPTPSLRWAKSLGQKSCRTKVSRIFVPNFAPNFVPNFSRIFRALFVLRFVGDGEQKKFTKNPRHFSMQNSHSQANPKKYSQNSSGEQAK